MDRKTWIAIALCIVGLVLWQWYYNKTYGPYLEQQRHAEAARRAAETARSADAASAEPAPAVAEAAPLPTPPLRPAAIEARSETLSAERQADFEFSNDTGGIQTARLLLHLGENEQSIALNGDRAMPIGAIGTVPGLAIGGFEMRADRAGREVVFTRRLDNGLDVEKRFTVPAAGDPGSPYVVNMALTFRNPGTLEITQPPYFISTGSAAPIHARDMPIYTRFNWLRGGKLDRIDVNRFNASSIPLIGIKTREATDLYQNEAGDIAWAAVTSQYFCTIVTPEQSDGVSVWAKRFTIPNGAAKVYGIQGGLGMPGFTLPSDASLSRTFQIYAGPKDLKRLEKLGHREQAVMDFGMFGFVSKFLLQAMNFLHGVFRSYALAIIVLTLLIKTALWPLQNKATTSMKKMAALSPKMTELREKYKDDPTRMNEELMKLYRDYGVNPFSGCLPMLIQIPIFFGFYAMLGTAIQLRNSPFLWVHDLSQPDTVAVIHLLGWNVPINVLPLVMAGTMVWQMTITPKTGDAAQQRILMFMPIIFVVFAYNFASALSLYWTTQNLFSIVQLYLTRNKPLPELEKKSVVAKREATAVKKKKRKKRP
jgi:YidC/Oxa1 family membrane protein insertase